MKKQNKTKQKKKREREKLKQSCTMQELLKVSPSLTSNSNMELKKKQLGIDKQKNRHMD